MTSKLKCPFCGEELYDNRAVSAVASRIDIYLCVNSKCGESDKLIGTKELWQALIQAKQDLKIARKALESISGIRGNIEDYYGGVSIHYQQMVLHMDEIATNALEQINHIADVSKMVGQN